MNWPASKLQARVAKGVLRDDLAALSNNYLDYINEALKEFQDKRSFICMRKDVNVTIPNQGSLVALPADFKELQVKFDGSPVNFVLSDPNNPGAMFPVDIVFEQQSIKRLWFFNGQISSWYGGLQVFMKKDSTGASLGINVPAQQDLTFRMSYNAYLPELSAPTDQNPISDQWPTMVISKAKSLALADVNDPVAETLDTFAELKFKQASFEDSRSDLVGRVLHM